MGGVLLEEYLRRRGAVFVAVFVVVVAADDDDDIDVAVGMGRCEEDANPVV